MKEGIENAVSVVAKVKDDNTIPMDTMRFTIPYGKGCLFASVPVGILQGALTLLACQAKTLLTDAALASLTTTGSIMILCLGINLIWNKEIRVANMLPMIIIGVALSYVPGL